MKVLVAPDKFKGSLSAATAAQAIARGWKAGWPEAEMLLCPIADGGEGFAEILCAALQGEWCSETVQDPLGRSIRARYVWIEAQQLAVLEMSEASGLRRLQENEKEPLAANTFGTGQLIRAAAERGAQQILVGLGGSATTDAGAGLAAALGYRLLDNKGADVPPEPQHFAQVARIERVPGSGWPEMVGACDVTNPLLGPAGTAHVFSQQKGAGPDEVLALERALMHWADVVTKSLGCDYRHTPGAGAAGGLGFGLLAFSGASLRSGFDLVAEAIDLEAKIAGCDLVITGEGRLDAQTGHGKGPGEIALLARQAGKPVLALAGSIEPGLDSTTYDWAHAITDGAVPLLQAMAGAKQFLEWAAATAARTLRGHPRLAARHLTMTHP